MYFIYLFCISVQHYLQKWAGGSGQPGGRLDLACGETFILNIIYLKDVTSIYQLYKILQLSIKCFFCCNSMKLIKGQVEYH